MNVWSVIVDRLTRLIERWLPPVAAWLAGRKSKADQIRRRQDEDEIRRLEARLARERDIARRADDDAERQRVRDAYTRRDGVDGA